jgi:hypothetical protein
MNTAIAVKLKRLARLIGRPVAIELFLPGGTLVVLGCLVTGRGSMPAVVPAPCKGRNLPASR